MQAKPKSARYAVPLLVAALLLPSNLIAQSGSPQPPSGGVKIDPSAGPLQPSEPQREAQPAAAPLPNAPQPAAPPAPQLPAQPAPETPLGAAAAEQIRTAGGSASRPAGNAIAPVKQHRYRSLAIKLGAAAAVGIAAGTVYGLSRATSSTPPHGPNATAAAR